MDEQQQALRDTAYELVAAGFRILPLGKDKMPLTPWSDAKYKFEGDETIELWFGEDQQDDDWLSGRHPESSGPAQGIAIVTGEPSGFVEMWELEGPHRDKVSELNRLAQEHGERTEDVWRRIRSGWMEQSPSGGYHWMVRITDCEEMPRSESLAEDPEHKKVQIAEVKAAKANSTMAPSYGHTHSTGKPYKTLTGGPDTIAEITMDERHLLRALFQKLDRRPAKPKREVGFQVARERNVGDPELPGDDYNQRADWQEILDADGWEYVRSTGNEDHWRRPGASTNGVDAAVYTHPDKYDEEKTFSLLYVPSAGALSQFGLPTEDGKGQEKTTYTKFEYYAFSRHSGDFSAAAKALSELGYGERKKAASTSRAEYPAASPQGAATGTDGVVIDLAAKRAEKDSVPGQQTNGATLERTDDANANRFASDHCEVIRFSSAHGVWVHWNGVRWVPQPGKGGIERELAKQTARALPTEEFDNQGKPDQSASNALAAHKKYSLSRQGINNMLSMANSLPQLRVDDDRFDNHPWELNTPGGILDLRTGQLLPHDPTKLHVKIAGVAPDFEADRTLWENFLHTSVPDPEVRRYLKRLVGLTLIGEVREHLIVFITGRSGRGKSTFVESIMTAMGDYAAVVPDGILLETKGSDDEETKAVVLKGTRLALIDEVKATDRLNEKRVKKFSGGNTLSARHLYQEHHNFTPSHTHFLVGNHRPGFDGSDDAMLRRLRTIPFDEDIPDEQKIPNLKEKIFGNLPAVLAWAAEGAVEYHKEGLGEIPDLVRATTSDYAEESNPVGQFLEERCKLADGETVLVSEFRDAYEIWCQQRQLRPLGDKRVADALERHGVKVGSKAPRTAQGRLYGGVKLLSYEERKAQAAQHNQELGYDEDPLTTPRQSKSKKTAEQQRKYDSPKPRKPHRRPPRRTPPRRS